MVALSPLPLPVAKYMAQLRAMKPKRILIGTPLKGDIPKIYAATSIKLAALAAKSDSIKFDWVMLDGPTIQVARNEIVAYAKDHGFDELIFWDKDVHSVQDGTDNTTEAILRLANHTEDIVCALYSNRSANTVWHVSTIEGEEPDEKTGLQKVMRSAIGFSKIKLSVFDKIAENNPELKGVLIDPGHPPRGLWEFFPIAMQGPNTPRERIAKIRAMLKDDLPNKLERIEREAFLVYDQPSSLIGEDFWFCDLARSAGFSIHLDTFMVMSHTGSISFPIPTGKLMEMLSEPWRKEERDAIAAELLKARNKK